MWPGISDSLSHRPPTRPVLHHSPDSSQIPILISSFRFLTRSKAKHDNEQTNRFPQILDVMLPKIWFNCHKIPSTQSHTSPLRSCYPIRQMQWILQQTLWRAWTLKFLLSIHNGTEVDTDWKKGESRMAQLPTKFGPSRIPNKGFSTRPVDGHISFSLHRQSPKGDMGFYVTKKAKRSILANEQI